MPQVKNMHGTNRSIPEGAVYIGRPTKWGNPFVISRDGDRAQVMKKYETWLMTQTELVAQAKVELKGKDLYCWCAPKACHGDVLLKVANS